MNRPWGRRVWSRHHLLPLGGLLLPLGHLLLARGLDLLSTLRRLGLSGVAPGEGLLSLASHHRGADAAPPVMPVAQAVRPAPTVMRDVGTPMPAPEMPVATTVVNPVMTSVVMREGGRGRDCPCHRLR
ncbi:hypothetical protein LOK46_30060 (plasmid) [Methylobacterium sp. NMS14P]|uniref:hypothetical protein n=1 Tax=Methylobacterium sp. NMS14P TaxID=2894310 RepID=UPI002359655B|nr:hypothetical protein [Methylobacterium sp. NMS14P]WCS28640.1 hypothetical protein LOK46_30060 [Methylobacterium sp. NMS14P]